MSFIHNSAFTLILSILFLNCTSLSSPTKSLAGSYTIHLEVKDLKINMDEVNKSMDEGIQNMKTELNSEKVKEELNTNNIDTSTIEGKIEFAAKNFAKGMTGFGELMAEFGTSIGQLSTGAISSVLSESQTLLNNVNAEVELKEDGSVKVAGNPILKFMAAQIVWEVQGDQFIVKNEKGEIVHQFGISDKTTEGFMLSNEKLKIVLKKKAMKI
ncbi:MAG: hypothetical protein IPP01_07040 [Saprospiraceae bacterium]|nr:hypothetical protein [Saprospiraceae bacterium]